MSFVLVALMVQNSYSTNWFYNWKEIATFSTEQQCVDASKILVEKQKSFGFQYVPTQYTCLRNK